MNAIGRIFVLTGLPVTWAVAAPDIEVQKSVDNAFPTAGEPVAFTVQVDNIGDETAADVVVIDQLPPEMAIPAGTAAFPSVGAYDPVTGEWTIGDLDSGTGATLVVPAIVTDVQPPDCIVNTAASEFVDIDGDSNDESRAVLHQNGVERCVDLDVNFGISNGPLLSSCGQEGQYSGDVEIINHGPDAARNVIVMLSLDPIVAPNVRFEDADCTNAPSAVCNIDEIVAGEMVTIDVTSDSYQSATPFTQTVSVSATTSDVDYDPSNDNPVVTGTGRAFSSCDELVVDVPGFAVGPSCFIATAAYGSPLDSRLDLLRGFRDRYLMTNRPGRAFVEFYYRHSPALAAIIAERDWLRAMVRGMLAPVVFTIAHPWWAALAFATLIGLTTVIRRARSDRL